jgi:hypothetical protein
MGKYLDILRAFDEAEREKGNEAGSSIGRADIAGPLPDSQSGRLGRTLASLERKCPEQVEVGRWQQAIDDGRRFLAVWGEQAEALGWTARDLFGLHVSGKPHPSYQRMARQDCTGLIWLLHGREVAVLTERSATVRSRAGAILVYRK